MGKSFAFLPSHLVSISIPPLLVHLDQVGSCGYYRRSTHASAYYLGALANPSPGNFALDNSVALGCLARRQADLCSASFQLSLSAHVHLQNHNAQKVAVLSGLSLSHCSGDGGGHYSAIRVNVCTCSAGPSFAAAATGARVRLHLNGWHIVYVVRLLLGEVWRVKCLLERSFLLFKRQRNRVKIASLNRCWGSLEIGADFWTEAWEQERVRPEDIIRQLRDDYGSFSLVDSPASAKMGR